MITKVAARGRSFKSLAAYMVNPKDGQHRALWSAVENVGSDNPDTAARIMAFTDKNADAIKKAAGIKNTGRKTKDGAVYHLILSWNVGQEPTQAEQEDAARSALKAIGLDRAQCLMAAHNDNGLSHVHLMVNLVDPDTGKRLPIGNDYEQLKAWALGYERDNGGVIIEKRATDEAKRARGERVERQPRMSRKEFDAMRAAQRAAFERQSAERSELRAVHSADWKEAKRAAAAHKAAYESAFRAELAKAKAAGKAENKTAWSSLFRIQEQAKRQAAYAIVNTEAAAKRAATTARAAQRDAERAERRDRSKIGRVVRLLVGGVTPDQARANARHAADRLREAADALTAAQKAQHALGATFEKQRRELADHFSQIAFAKAQSALAELPRVSFAAMIRRQDEERRRLIEQQNAERAALNMKPYEPKGAPIMPQTFEQHAEAVKDKPRNAFNPEADRRQAHRREAAAQPVQGAAPHYTPSGYSTGNTPAAPVKKPAAEQDQASTDATSATTSQAFTKTRTMAEIKADRAANPDRAAQQAAAEEAARKLAQSRRKTDQQRKDHGNDGPDR